jgi:hypothetical protein
MGDISVTRAITWAVGIAVVLSMTMLTIAASVASGSYDGLRGDLKAYATIQAQHGERLATGEADRGHLTSRICILEKSIAQHVYNTGP